jgi:response regulator RpfG family c-di-GMP phosphodiesterase
LEKTVAFLNVEQEELRQNFKIFLKIFSSTSVRHCGLPPDYMINLLAHIEMCGERLYMSENQLECVNQAAKLAQIGKLNLAPEVVSVNPDQLSERQFQQLKNYPIESVNMLTPIDALQETMVIILHHQENFDGSGYPYGFSEHNISLGGRLLKILMDFNLLIAVGGPGKAMQLDNAIEKMREGSGSMYDPDLLEICLNVLQGAGILSHEGRTDLDSLNSGDELARDAYTADGLLIGASGIHLSDAMIRRFRDIQNSHHEKLTFSIK